MLPHYVKFPLSQVGTHGIPLPLIFNAAIMHGHFLARVEKYLLELSLGHAVYLFQRCPEKIISYMWGDHMIPVPYKVRGTISHWQLQGSHIPHKVWGHHESLTVTRFQQWTLIMKTLHIDRYKVPAVDSDHVIHVGGMACPCSWGLGLYLDLWHRVSTYKICWVSIYRCTFGHYL